MRPETGSVSAPLRLRVSALKNAAMRKQRAEAPSAQRSIAVRRSFGASGAGLNPPIERRGAEAQRSQSRGIFGRFAAPHFGFRANRQGAKAAKVRIDSDLGVLGGLAVQLFEPALFSAGSGARSAAIRAPRVRADRPRCVRKKALSLRLCVSASLRLKGGAIRTRSAALRLEARAPSAGRVRDARGEALREKSAPNWAPSPRAPTD